MEITDTTRPDLKTSLQLAEWSGPVELWFGDRDGADNPMATFCIYDGAAGDIISDLAIYHIEEGLAPEEQYWLAIHEGHYDLEQLFEFQSHDRKEFFGTIVEYMDSFQKPDSQRWAHNLVPYRKALRIAEEHIQKMNPSGWDGKGDMPKDFDPRICTYEIEPGTELDISFEEDKEWGWHHLCELRDKDSEELLEIRSGKGICRPEEIAFTAEHMF